MADRRFWSNLAIVASLAGVYFGAGKLGLALAFVHPSATAVWPPTGIALAAFLALGYRVWPGIFLGAFLVNVTTAGSVATSMAIAVGNTLEGALGAYLVNRFANGPNPFDRPKDFFRFVALAGMLSTTVSATFGVTSLLVGGFAGWANYGAIWFTWWLGDAVGAVVVAPVLLLWSRDPRLGWSRWQAVEAVLLLLSVFLLGLVVFGGFFPSETKHYPVAFLSIPLLIWAALRFGQREAATATLALAGIAIWGTLSGFGPFALWSPNESLLLLQAFIGVEAMMTLALAAVVSERRRLSAEAEELAVHRDRVRLASKLHETLSQLLFSMALKLDWCLHRVPEASGVQPKLEEIRLEIGLMMAQIRGLIAQLASDDGDARTFPEQLRGLANQFRDLTGIAVQLIARGDLTRLGQPQQEVLRLTFLEALANTARHARATHATIRLEVGAGQVRFEVVDNGIGPGADPASLAGDGHFGLRRMRDRVEALGGRLQAGPAAPSGFRLRGTLPLGGEADAR